MRHIEHKTNKKDAAPLTATPVQIPTVTPTAAVRPEWIRLPKPGTLCPWCGLGRSKIWQVLQTGKVRNICLRKEGGLRGARLISLTSLLAYFDSLPDEADKIGADDGATDSLASTSSELKPQSKGGH